MLGHACFGGMVVRIVYADHHPTSKYMCQQMRAKAIAMAMVMVLALLLLLVLVLVLCAHGSAATSCDAC